MPSVEMERFSTKKAIMPNYEAIKTEISAFI
jgi:hypothetical protein